MNEVRIFVCAGEASGDLHAAALMAELKRRLAPRRVLFRGFGGDAMREAGCQLFFHTDQTSVIGFTAVLARLPFFLRMRREIQEEIDAWQPDVVITVDYPGMNLRIDEFAHAHGYKTVHYICPQVWAWHRGRIPKLARIMDRLLCIFPFEPALFEKTGLDARYVGHPLVDRARETRAQERRQLPWGDKKYHIALLPGSRRGEITRILPRLLQAAALLEKRTGNACSFLIPASSHQMRELIESLLAKQTSKELRDLPLAVIDGSAREVLLQADAAAVASGTATLEACLMRCPTVLVYAVGWLTAIMAHLLIRGVKWIGLANIVAGREVMPELLQSKFTPENLCNELNGLLREPVKRASMLRGLDVTNAKLGDGGASQRAADCICELLEGTVTPSVDEAGGAG